MHRKAYVLQRMAMLSICTASLVPAWLYSLWQVRGEVYGLAHVAERFSSRAALRAPAPQVCSLALFKNTRPIIRTVQLDKLNNKGLHNKVSKTLNQVNAVAATPRPTADAADAADAMHADLLEPLAAAECLLAPVATAALLLLLPWLMLLLTPLAPPLPLTLLATLPLTLPMPTHPLPQPSTSPLFQRRCATRSAPRSSPCTAAKSS